MRALSDAPASYFEIQTSRVNPALRRHYRFSSAQSAVTVKPTLLSPQVTSLCEANGTGLGYLPAVLELQLSALNISVPSLERIFVALLICFLSCNYLPRNSQFLPLR